MRTSSSIPLTHREPEYTTFRDLKLWLGTWNVNGKKIDENINMWFTGSVTGKPTVDLTATTVVLEAQSQKRASVWLEMIGNALNKSAKNDVGLHRRYHPRKRPT